MRAKNAGQIGLHFLGGFAMAYVGGGSGPGMVAVVLAAWLLREAAQANPGHLLAALRGLPAWSLQKHLEWLAPGGGGAVALLAL